MLSESGIAVQEEAFPSPDQLVDVIQHNVDAIDCVIIGGGDGTLNAAAPALVKTGLPLGILPLGTANDLARTLEISSDPVAAAQSHRRRLDQNARPWRGQWQTLLERRQHWSQR